MKLDSPVLQFLTDYLLGKVMGSYLLVKVGLLDVEDINDIDIAFTESIAEGVRKYLTDQGYTEKKQYGAYSGNPVSTGIFIKGVLKSDIGYLPIHILSFKKEVPDIYSTIEILQEKIERRSVSDLAQLRKAIEKLTPNVEP